MKTFYKNRMRILLLAFTALCVYLSVVVLSTNDRPVYGQTNTPVLFALLTSTFDNRPGSPAPASAIEIVNLVSMTRRKTLSLGPRIVTSLAVSADAKRIYVTDQTNNVVLVTDASTGNSLASIPLNGPRDLVMSPDGSTLFANGSDSIVSINTANNSIRNTFQTIAAAGQRDVTLGLAISPDGQLLATPAQCQSVCNDGLDDGPAAYLIDTSNMTLRARVSVTNPGEPTNCATSPNDVVFTPNRILLWDANCDNLYQLDSNTFAQLTLDTVRLGRDSGSSFNYNNILSFSSRTGRAYVIKEGEPGPGGHLVPSVGIIDPIQRTSSTIAGFNGTAFVPAITPEGSSLYVSVMHKVSGGGPDTLDRYDATTNSFTRSIYTFSPAMMVRDMRVVSIAGVPATAAGTIVPLYTYPTHSSWNAIISAKQGHPTVEVIAVVNPCNGPGPCASPPACNGPNPIVDSNYTNGTGRLHSAGIKILGYVYTHWTQRLSTDVRADIDCWRKLYPQVDGIFFDEMANTNGGEAYYRDLTAYAKSKGFTFTVGNPGADSLPSYVGTVDVLLVYENSGLPNSSVLISWHAGFDRSNFGILAYKVSSLNPQFVANAKTTVRYQYMTEDDLPNPWDSLSNYFDSLLATLQ